MTRFRSAIGSCALPTLAVFPRGITALAGKFSLHANKLTFALLGALIAHSTANAVTINFDSLPGMTNLPGQSVPVASQLTDAFLLTDGVSFTSTAGYVAVIEHAPDPTTSLPNVIGGVTADGLLSYGTPVDISFFDPSNPATKATTDFVSIRGDQAPLAGATATMEAFDILGASLGTVSDSDSVIGLTLSLNIPGIHFIRVTQDSADFGADGTIGLDDLTFNPVTAVPLPATLWLFGSALGLLGWARRGRA